MSYLNFNKFKNRLYLLFKDILSIFTFPIIPRSYTVFVVLPCLLVIWLIFAWDKPPIFLNSSGVFGEGIFKQFISIIHSSRGKHYRISEKIVFCDFRSKSGPQFSPSNLPGLSLCCFQGKPVCAITANEYTQQCSADADESHITRLQFYTLALVGWTIGIAIGVGLIRLFFWWQHGI